MLETITILKLELIAAHVLFCTNDTEKAKDAVKREILKELKKGEL